MGILRALAANPADGGQALFKGREPAIGAAKSIAVIRAPGIILGFRAGAKADNRGENSNNKEQ